MKHRLKVDLSRVKDPQLIVQGRSVVAGMTTHPALTGPLPGFLPNAETVKAAIDKLEDAYNAALTRDAQKIAARKEARKAVEVLLQTLAQFYETAAISDRNLLNNTGYELRRESKIYSNPLEGPFSLSVFHGNFPGVIVAKTARVPGAVSYEVHFTEGNPLDGNWTFKGVYSHASRMEMTNLEGGKIYSFRARVIGSAGAGPWSDAVSLRAL
jgi:hypothetical protein